jgi:predicted DNA-binding transcriptional regulator YafY
MDVCPVTSRARLSYRRAEEIFEESTRLLANPLARPEQWTELRGLTAVAVVLGLLTAQRFGVAAGGALAEVGRVLPDALRDRVAALRGALEFTAAAREGAMPDSAVLLLPASAVRERRRVRLVYRWSWKGETGERDRRSGHALRARVRLRPRPPARPGADVPGRPGGPGPAAAADEVPGDFDAVAHLTRSLAAVPYAHEVEVVLETSLAEARRRIPATVATLSGTDGAVTVRLRAERLDGVARMLAGLGVPFVIRGPGELRAVVRRLGRDLLRSAEAGEDA